MVTSLNDWELEKLDFHDNDAVDRTGIVNVNT